MEDIIIKTIEELRGKKTSNAEKLDMIINCLGEIIIQSKLTNEKLDLLAK